MKHIYYFTSTAISVFAHTAPPWAEKHWGRTNYPKANWQWLQLLMCLGAYQQAKHFFLIFIPFPHKCASQNHASCSYLSWADWQFLRHRGWLCDQTLGKLCSTLFLHGGTALYCRILPATIYWDWIYHWEQYSFSCPQFIIYFIVIEEENLENFLLRWLNEWKNYEVLFCQNNFWLIAQYIFFFLVWIFLFLPCHCFYGLHPLLSISL